MSARTASYLLFDPRTSSVRMADFGRVPNTSDTPGFLPGEAALRADLLAQFMPWVRSQFRRCPAIHGETVPVTGQLGLSAW